MASETSDTWSESIKTADHILCSNLILSYYHIFATVEKFSDTSSWATVQSHSLWLVIYLPTVPWAHHHLLIGTIVKIPNIFLFSREVLGDTVDLTPKKGGTNSSGSAFVGNVLFKSPQAFTNKGWLVTRIRTQLSNLRGRYLVNRVVFHRQHRILTFLDFFWRRKFLCQSKECSFFLTATFCGEFQFSFCPLLPFQLRFFFPCPCFPLLGFFWFLFRPFRLPFLRSTTLDVSGGGGR